MCYFLFYLPPQSNWYTSPWPTTRKPCAIFPQNDITIKDINTECYKPLSSVVNLRTELLHSLSPSCNSRLVFDTPSLHCSAIAIAGDTPYLERPTNSHPPTSTWDDNTAASAAHWRCGNHTSLGETNRNDHTTAHPKHRYHTTALHDIPHRGEHTVHGIGILYNQRVIL